MFVLNNCRSTIIAAFVAIAAQFCAIGEPFAQNRPISIFISRHAEADTSQPTVPLTAVGRQRADLLVHTFGGVKFTHLFATHTTRTRQMIERIASNHGLVVTQLPAPGSMLDGQTVTDDTSRRAPIEPIAAALLKLPPGSVALAALNSENIFAILNGSAYRLHNPGSLVRLAVCAYLALTIAATRAKSSTIFGTSCANLGRAEPLAFVKLRYGAGWRGSDR